MFCASDRGYIVVDDRKNRSIKDFICEQNASGSARHLFQISLLPNSLFVHNGIQAGSLEQLLDELKNSDLHKVMNYTKTSTAARVLATQSRRADVNGPPLQHVHIQIGRFLADKLLDEVGRFGSLIDQETFSPVQGSALQGLLTS